MPFILSKKSLQNNINKKKYESVLKALNRSHTTQNNHQIPIIQRKLNCPCGGGCPRCAKKTPVQAKLKIGAPNDKYEQEADRVAEQVMRIPDPENKVSASDRTNSTQIQRTCAECKEDDEEEPIQTKPLAGQTTPLVQRKEVQEEDEEEGENEQIQTKSISAQITPLIQRQELEEPDEEEEESLQTKEVSNNSNKVTSNLETNINSLRGNGKPLPKSERAFFEPRFGHDFSQVRVHTGVRAAKSTQAVNAKAYTVGRNVVFSAGQYAPSTHEGRRLIAHELAHVIQQTGALNTTLQRKAPKPKKLRDTIVLLSNDRILIAEAKSLAPDALVLRVKDPKEMRKKLAKLKFPIGRLYIVGHSLETGDLGFDKGSERKYIDPKEVARQIKGAIPSERAPEAVDFRGCSIGSSPEGMDAIRDAVGAKEAVGGNCFMIVQPNGPIELSGKKITKASQITAKNRGDFEEGFKKLIDLFGPKRDCIFNRSEDAYFRAGGKLLAVWFNPEFEEKWDERKSICYSRLKPETVDPKSKEDFSPGLAGNCRLIKVEKDKTP